MKYTRVWLNKQLSKSYDRSRLTGLAEEKFMKECEKFIDENRKRIQDLELVTREIIQKLEKIKRLADGQ